MVEIPPLEFTIATPVLHPSQFTCVTLAAGIDADTIEGSTISTVVVNEHEFWSVTSTSYTPAHKFWSESVIEPEDHW